MRRLFWLFLIILIFVLWVMSAERPWCRPLPETISKQLEQYRATEPNARGDRRVEGVAIFDDSVRARSHDIAATDRHPAPAGIAPPTLSSLGMTASEQVQPIPRPGTSDPEPFGYDLFRGADGAAATDAYAAIAPDDYMLGPGDELVVNVWGRIDLNFKLTVDREGSVFIPQAGPVRVSGMTMGSAEGAVRGALDKIYSDYELSCTLARMRTVRVFVFGEVRRPGAYVLSASATAIDALYRAGGPSMRGSLRRVRLMRRGNVHGQLDLYEFLLTGRRSNDPNLTAGDVVFVPIAGPRVVARGHLRRPAVYELLDNDHLSELIDLAGGFAANAHAERVMIDRIGERDGRELLDIPLVDGGVQVSDPSMNPVLRDGDDVSVFSKYELRDNLVWLVGAVKHPGVFERTDGMTVGDLVDGGDQLRETAYTERADLIRFGENGRRSIRAVDLEAIVGGEGERDVMLEDRDSLVVHTRSRVETASVVHIDGAVRRPGQYPLYQGMRVSDLVFLAGNPTKRAWLVHAEVARADSNGQIRIFDIALADVLRGDLAADSVLVEDDRIFVREALRKVGPGIVTITGEVRFPGRYALGGTEGDDRLSDLVVRAGGLTSHAFPEGTIFTRARISDEFNRKNLGTLLRHSQPVREDSTGALVRDELVSFNPESMSRIIIDVPRILDAPGSANDIVLVDEDQIHIPAVPSGIQLLGAVGAPGTIQFHARWNVRDYLKRAGGFGPNADKKGVRLVKADGRVHNGSSVKGRRVEVGDAIFVPGRIERKRDWLRDLGQTMSIIGGLATTVLVIDRIGN